MFPYQLQDVPLKTSSQILLLEPSKLTEKIFYSGVESFEDLQHCCPLSMSIDITCGWWGGVSMLVAGCITKIIKSDFAPSAIEFCIAKIFQLSI